MRGLDRPVRSIDADRPAGAHVLTADELLYAGQTRRQIRIEAGRTYFFLIRSSKRHDAVNGLNGLAFAGGLAGAAIATVATAGDENPGPCGYFPVGRCDGEVDARRARALQLTFAGARAIAMPIDDDRVANPVDCASPAKFDSG
jgi:hypothetical protein